MSIIPKVSQLSSRVWRFLGCNPSPMTLQGTNIYLVGTGARRILIDVGQDGFPEYISALTSFLREGSISLERILVTHWHQDHIGALEDLGKALGSSISPQARLPVHKFRRKEVVEKPLPEGYILKQLEDNQLFSTEGATLRILFNPGHTTDHAALYLQEERAIFSGDCILGEGTGVFEDLYDYMKSLEKMLGENPEIIYPAHGNVVNDPKGKIQFYLKHRMQREAQILQALKTSGGKPMTPREIVDVVYTEIADVLKPAAEVNVGHHLGKLVKDRKVRENEGGTTYMCVEEGKM